MDVLNCWQFKKCGRELGGARVSDLGVCPAATAIKADGLNHGKNGGRACWAVAGTLCGGQVQGTFATKLGTCLSCDFYDAVLSEEGSGLVASRDILTRLG